MLSSLGAALFARYPDAVLVIDAEGAIQEANPAATQLLGYTREELRQLRSSAVIVNQPDDLVRNQAAVWRAEGRLGALTLRCKDGARIQVEAWADMTPAADGDLCVLFLRDLSIQQHVANEIRERGARFRSVFERTAIGMTAIDLAGRFMRVNSAMCSLTGYSETELLRKNERDITHPDDRPAGEELFARLVAGEMESYDREKRYVREDGQIVWVRLGVTLVRDDLGAPSSVFGQCSDITAQKSAEVALQAAEAKYRALVEHVPAAVYLQANDGHYTPLYYNSYIETLTGETPAEAVAFNDHWLERVHPDDRERVAAEDSEPAIIAGTFRAEYRRRRKDGSYVWVWDIAAPLRDESGQITAWQGVLLDITARKEAEAALAAERELLTAVLESIPDAVFVKDTSSRFVRLNAATASQLEIPDAAEALGKTDFDFFPEPLAREFFGDEQRLFATGALQTSKTERQTGPIDARWVLSTKVPLRDKQGAIVGLVGINRDITTLHDTEEELRQALAAAQAANLATSQFLRIMSHELRTPMQAVLGYADLLLTGPDQERLTEQQREDVLTIRQGAERMVVLVGQILDLSRLEAGRLELAIETVDVAKIIEQVRKDIAPQAAAKGLELCVDVPPHLPSVQADPLRVHQILLNLAGNAVKFTEHGTISLKAMVHDAHLEVAVTDTGIGIDAEALPHIFEEFRQADSGMTRRHTGAGLGLAIARKLAEQHNGTISVTSELGKGSTFTLSLPIAGPHG